jgi:hypothetical protein
MILILQPTLNENTMPTTDIINQFLQDIEQPDHEFTSTLSFIERHYTFSPTVFLNTNISNAQDKNQGACKVFALSHLLSLSTEQTVKCFGEHYRDVINTPNNDNHMNIRCTMQHGLSGITFNVFPLIEKSK